jgi:hypothetical protein
MSSPPPSYTAQRRASFAQRQESMIERVSFALWTLSESDYLYVHYKVISMYTVLYEVNKNLSYLGEKDCEFFFCPVLSIHISRAFKSSSNQSLE